MMKNSKMTKILLIILTISLSIPINVNAKQQTYGDILDDLSAAQKQLDKNNQSINNTQDQIEDDNDTIKKLKSEIEKMKEENTKIQQEIAQANVDIEEMKEQTQDLIAYLQMSQGENVYLEYVFGSDSITDMIYRLSIVEQITEYNDNTVKKLENLISANEKKKVELAENEEKAEQKIENLNSEISKLNKTVSNLDSLTPSLKEEVKAKKELVDYYKSQGCSKRSDVIGVDCAVTTANKIFSRPVKNGYVTSFTGYRRLCVKGKCSYSLHRGIDIGSRTGKNTPLYSIGYGVVTAIWQDSARPVPANNINIQYMDSKGTYYTAIYSHLSRYASNIKVGTKVTPDTIIGYMGATGNVTGVHLHLEVYPCKLWDAGQCSTWDKYVSFAKKKFESGYKGSESVINFPSRTYTTWYTK